VLQYRSVTVFQNVGDILGVGLLAGVGPGLVTVPAGELDQPFCTRPLLPFIPTSFSTGRQSPLKSVCAINATRISRPFRACAVVSG
jgi:hypothetical protein